MLHREAEHRTKVATTQERRSVGAERADTLAAQLARLPVRYGEG